MHFDSEKIALEHKFSFFKRNKKTDRKRLKFKDNLMIGIFFLFVISTGNSSIDRYHTLSKTFQQRVVQSYTPIAPTSKQFVSKDSPEMLVGYLAKQDVGYEDLDKSIEIVKANQKDLPSYIVTHTISKLKSDNLNLYRQYSKQVRDEYFYMMSVGVPRFMISEQLRIENKVKLDAVMTAYNDNFEKMEAKINVLLPIQAKISELKDINPKLALKGTK
jgi:hypothetical protein